MQGAAAARVSLWERLGDEFFEQLASRFYEGVVDDPLLRPMYPDELEQSVRHLAGFLSQYWGGPPLYSQQRGHPRLRMRHAAFPIDEAARDAWLRHMRAAVVASAADVDDQNALLEYFAMAAQHLVNHPA